MTQGMKEEPIPPMGTNKMALRHVCDKPFMVRFPDRSEWKDALQPDRKVGTNLVHRWLKGKLWN
jgi:hypothetical protein